MRTLFFFAVLFIDNFLSIGQIDFLNRVSLKHEKIELSDQTYWIETSPNKWKLIGNLNFVGINKSELPEKPQCFAWINGDNRILNIEGSGQVYKLSTKKLIFERLDQTYFRGYNFGALKFVRKDTLFSYGGLGFWHVTNVETFYNFPKKEWDLVRHSDNSPRRILNNLAGYDRSRDVLSVIEAPEAYEERIPSSFRYFELDFTSNNWVNKGIINFELLEELGIHKMSSDFINGCFIFRNGLIVIVGDPINNLIYQYDGAISDFFESSYELIDKDDTIYSLKYTSRVNSLQPLKIDSLSIDSFRKHLTPKGAFYSKNSIIELEKSVYIFIIISLITITVILIKKIKKGKSSNNVLFGLAPSSIEFLRGCLQFPQGHEFNSNDFTEMMGYARYSFETQRQVRSKQISIINEYFSLNHNMDGVIERFSAKEDKRFSVYKISENHFQVLKVLLA